VAPALVLATFLLVLALTTIWVLSAYTLVVYVFSTSTTVFH
jgi:hypothetical protein